MLQATRSLLELKPINGWFIKSVGRSGQRLPRSGLSFQKRLAPRDGFEPPAKRLTVACSTAELPGKNTMQSVIQNKTRYATCFQAISSLQLEKKSVAANRRSPLLIQRLKMLVLRLTFEYFLYRAHLPLEPKY